MEWEILTAEEAAAALRVAPDVVVLLLEANEISGRIVEGSWRTTRRALASFVDGVPLQGDCCSTMCCGPGCETGCGKRCC